MWLVIGLTMILLFNLFNKPQGSSTSLTYSEFISSVENKAITRIHLNGDVISGTTVDGKPFQTIYPLNDSELIPMLRQSGVDITVKEAQKDSWFMTIFVSWFPMLLLIGVWVFFMRQMQGGGKGGALSFGKNRARLMEQGQNKVTFADVAGIDEAKEELEEIIDFLRDPQKFTELGGRIPKGVLLAGPPGTGKTLLAKAIAGEAKVPFFSISGSDFVEMFVGVGASRVRDMFDQAKKHAPCIIFIDEIDAVGRHRGAGMGGGNDEREQTLNQLLVEMDGFEGTEGIIVIAATNRPDVLDQALLRPGRFDRQVHVGLPDIRGREQILKVHMRKVPLGDDVKPELISRGTPGFSGADLANLVNEAALFAARENRRTVSMDQFEKAKDKIMMGAERKSMVMSYKERLNTAYHESGHAIIGRLMPEHDPVYKVSIIPRGRALGVTMFLPEEDRYSHNRQSIISQICSLYGGRLAEEMTLGKDGVTTGASNDIQKATMLARNMVTKWGLSDELGPLLYGDEDDDPFGRGMGQAAKAMSDETQKKIDAEVRRIIDGCYAKAKQMLEDNRDILDAMAEALMKYETIGSEQLDQLMARQEVSPPDGWVEAQERADQAERDIEEARQSRREEAPRDDAQQESAADEGESGESDAPGEGRERDDSRPD
jgi:cell division protease FtsH